MINTQSKLRDPIWQSIGVFVSVVGLISSILLTAADQRELVAVTASSLSPSGFLPESQFKVVDTKTGEVHPHLQVDYIFIVNKGSKAVRPNDIVEPIRITSTYGSVLAASSCAGNSSMDGYSASVKLDWKSDDAGWVATPALLNSGESACVAVLTTARFEINKNASRFRIHARIADTTFVGYETYNDYKDKALTATERLRNLTISLSGRSIILFLLLQAFVFVSIYILGQLSGVLGGGSVKTTLALVLILPLATIVAFGLSGAFDTSERQVDYVLWTALALIASLGCTFLVLAFRRRVKLRGDSEA